MFRTQLASTISAPGQHPAPTFWAADASSTTPAPPQAYAGSLQPSGDISWQNHFYALLGPQESGGSHRLLPVEPEGSRRSLAAANLPEHAWLPRALVLIGPQGRPVDRRISPHWLWQK